MKVEWTTWWEKIENPKNEVMGMPSFVLKESWGLVVNIGVCYKPIGEQVGPNMLPKPMLKAET